MSKPRKPRSASRPSRRRQAGAEVPAAASGFEGLPADDVTASDEASTIPEHVSEPRPNRRGRAEPLLLECAWEVCNQVGGIYQVLRSKAPTMVKRWGDRYALVGPYFPNRTNLEFEPTPLEGPLGDAVRRLTDQGLEVHFGRWLVTGRPHVILLNHLNIFPFLHEVKYRLWKDHGISLPGEDELLNNVSAFGEISRRLLHALTTPGHPGTPGTPGHPGDPDHAVESVDRPIIAHFHEWMAGAAIPMLRHDRWPGSIVFTTHATMLGRYLAMNDQWFYEHLPHYDHAYEARHFNIEPQHHIERAAAHGAHIFSTVSDVTADECRYLLGRTPEVLVPNGLNIQRFAALHEFQNLHNTAKERIHEFTIGHFFPSYTIDLDKTLYFYTSGRFEPRNKGMDMTIEALARLNHMLQASGSEVTVVAFIITQRPIRSINVTALQSSAALNEFRTIVDNVKEQIGKRLFRRAASGEIPDLNELVDEYWRLRLRRAIHAWQRDLPPGIVTHDLVDDQNDPVLNQLRAAQLWNQRHDRVKVVYHPSFMNSTNPLFGLEYDAFVRGCHLGVFPSYYEPWGYTPLESIALGVPAMTSDLAGFGAFVRRNYPDHQQNGVWVVDRRYRSWEEATHQTAQVMFDFCRLTRRERIALRNSVESFSVQFDWANLGRHYHDAHDTALMRMGE